LSSVFRPKAEGDNLGNVLIPINLCHQSVPGGFLRSEQHLPRAPFKASNTSLRVSGVEAGFLEIASAYIAGSFESASLANQ
jgi:hypothetical protein